MLTPDQTTVQWAPLKANNETRRKTMNIQLAIIEYSVYTILAITLITLAIATYDTIKKGAK